MRRKLMLWSLLALAVAGCPSGNPPANNGQRAETTTTPAPAKRMASKLVILSYSNDTEKAAEEARLNKILDEGWRVVSTDTKFAEKTGFLGRDTTYKIIVWTITVTLEREVRGD